MLRLLSHPAKSRLLPTIVKTYYLRVARRFWGKVIRTSIVQSIPNIGIMKLNPSDLVSTRLFHCGTWEPVISDFIRAHIQQAEGKVAIDIGANIGYYTLMFSSLMGETGNVYAIEPAPLIRQWLEENISLNRLGNVVVIPYGISDRPETRVFHVNTANNLGGSYFGERHDEQTSTPNTLQLKRLTDVIPAPELSRTVVIKVDVEGMEDVVLLDLLSNLHLFPELKLIVAELRFDNSGSMASLTRKFVSKRFETYLLPNSYDAAFYVARTKPQAKVTREFTTGMHDVAFLRG